MIDIFERKLLRLPQKYAENFFASVFYNKLLVTDDFIWVEADRYELYFSGKGSCYYDEELVNRFIELQQCTGKVIACYSNRPLNRDLIPCAKNENVCIRLNYFAAVTSEVECGIRQQNKLLFITDYNRDYDAIMRSRFLADDRLYSADRRMKTIYERMLYEEYEAEIRGDCEHLYIVNQDKLIAYISGTRVPKEEYGNPVYLVLLVWIASDIKGQMRSEIRQVMREWLRQRSGPFGATIYFDNLPSQKFFTSMGFRPYFVRYIPW